MNVSDIDQFDLPKLERIIADCACHHPEHVLHFLYDGELYIEIHLNPNYGFFRRLWIAIKYIFGYKCRDGCFETWMMDGEDADKLIEMLNRKKLFDQKGKESRLKTDIDHLIDLLDPNKITDITDVKAAKNTSQNS